MKRKLLFIAAYGAIGLPAMVAGFLFGIVRLGWLSGRYHAAVLFREAIPAETKDLP